MYDNSTRLGPVVGKKETFNDERFDEKVNYLAFTGKIRKLCTVRNTNLIELVFKYIILTKLSSYYE